MPIFCCFHCLTIKPKLFSSVSDLAFVLTVKSKLLALFLYVTWPLHTSLALPQAPVFLLFLNHTLLFLCWALRHMVCSSHRDLSPGFHMAAASSSRFLFVSPPERSLLIKKSKQIPFYHLSYYHIHFFHNSYSNFGVKWLFAHFLPISSMKVICSLVYIQYECRVRHIEVFKSTSKYISNT